MNTSTIAKAGATVLAAGVVAGVGLGAFGGWTDSDTASMAVQFGNVDLGLGSSTLTTAFGTSSSPLAPGDSGYRYVQLTNSGSNALALTPKLWVSIGAVTDAIGTSATATDIAGDIKVTIDSCSVAWTQSNNSCSGTTSNIASTTGGVYLSTLDASNESLTMTASLAKDATLNLRFTLAVDALASMTTATDGAAVTLTWTFDSTARAAITTQ